MTDRCLIDVDPRFVAIRVVVRQFWWPCAISVVVAAFCTPLVWYKCRRLINTQPPKASLAAILHHVSAINVPFVSHMLLQHRIYLSWFPANIWPHVNSFTPGRRGCDSKCVVSLTHFSDFILGISCEINPKWLTQILFDATSAVVNVMLWGRLQTRYCLVQRCPKLSPGHNQT